MNFGTRFVSFITSAATLAAQLVGSNPDNHQGTYRLGGGSDGSETASDEVIILEDGGRLIPNECR